MPSQERSSFSRLAQTITEKAKCFEMSSDERLRSRVALCRDDDRDSNDVFICPFLRDYECFFSDFIWRLTDGRYDELLGRCLDELTLLSTNGERLCQILHELSIEESSISMSYFGSVKARSIPTVDIH
jgi:hypothetical protein